MRKSGLHIASLGLLLSLALLASPAKVLAAGLVAAPTMKSWVIPEWGQRRNLKQYQSPIGPASLPIRSLNGVRSTRRNDLAEFLPKSLGGMDRQDHLDGAIIGGNEKLTSGRVPLSQVRGFVSTKVLEGPRVRLIDVNGVRTDAKVHAQHLQLIADRFAAAGLNVEVVGLHNGTDGTVRDFVQVAKDITTFGRGHNQSTGNLRDQILYAIDHGEQLNLLGHSQGAIIMSRALIEAKTELVVERKLTDVQADALVGAHVTLTTYGGASACYIDPVLHVYNPHDIVASSLGAGLKKGVPSPPISKVAHAMAPAVVELRKLVRTEPLAPPGIDLGNLSYADIYRQGNTMIVDSGKVTGLIATHDPSVYWNSLTATQTKEIFARFRPTATSQRGEE
jgi:hypothetical protein